MASYIPTEYEYFLNRFIRPIDGTRTGKTFLR